MNITRIKTEAFYRLVQKDEARCNLYFRTDWIQSSVMPLFLGFPTYCVSWQLWGAFEVVQL